MPSNSSTCVACGAAMRPAAAFCTACGRFALSAAQDPVLPPLPVSKQNPLVALEGTFTGRRDPRSKLTPEHWQQSLFMHRRSLATLLEEGEVSAVAEAEFEREVAPKLFEGSMSPLVHDGWRRHWGLVSEFVYSLRGLLGDQPDEPGCTNDTETWSNPHPAYAALRQRLRADLDARVARLGETHGDLAPLIQFELQLQASLAALQRLTRQMEALRLSEALGALGWVRKLNEAGIRNVRDVNDTQALLGLFQEVQEQFNNHRTRLHPQRAAAEAMAARFDEVDAALVQFVKTEPELYLQGQAWLERVARRLVVTSPELLDRVLKADRLQASELRAAAENAIHELMREFVSEGKRCAAELAREAEQARQDAARRREMREAAALTASLQSAMVDELLTKQQILRQQSEGKFGAALATQVFGASGGATWEGFLK